MIYPAIVVSLFYYILIEESVTVLLCVWLQKFTNTVRVINIGGILYTAHGAQITPPPLLLIFVYFCFHAYIRLG